MVTGVISTTLLSCQLYIQQSYFEIPLINRGFVSAHSAHLDSLRGVKMNAWNSELWNIAEWDR